MDLSEMESKKEGLLPGIQILDLADEKGSFCSKLLADLGARVIKVERPGGDPSRRAGPFLEDLSGTRESLLFYHNNTNKLGITLNLEYKDGKEIFLKLLQKTDIVVESFSPDYVREINLGFDVLSLINPRLIVVSITGFGQNGPRSQYKSCDLVASAFGGQMSVCGSSSTPPLKPFGEQPYYTASLFAAVGILLALRKRAQTGTGEHLDISLQEAVVSTMDDVMVRFFYDKVIAKRQGNLYGNKSFAIFQCRDGPILISISQQWEVLVEWVDSEGMAEDLKDEKYREEEYRLRHLDHILDVLKRWTRSHTTRELFEQGQSLRFPWATVSSPRDVLNNPQLEARGFFTIVEHPEMGRPVFYPGSPYRFSLSRGRRWKRAPLVGEDNAAIYRGELGLSEEEYRRLSSSNVI